MTSLTLPAYIPRNDDAQLSQTSSRILAKQINPAAPQIKLIEPDDTEQTVMTPTVAYRL